MILKLSEWQDYSGWHCNDVSAIGKGSADWLNIPAGLHMTPSSYVQYLIEHFRPDHVYWSPDKGFFMCSWDNQADMRKFKNWANAQFRRNQYEWDKVA